MVHLNSMLLQLPCPVLNLFKSFHSLRVRVNSLDFVEWEFFSVGVAVWPSSFPYLLGIEIADVQDFCWVEPSLCSVVFLHYPRSFDTMLKNDSAVWCLVARYCLVLDSIPGGVDLTAGDWPHCFVQFDIHLVRMCPINITEPRRAAVFGPVSLSTNQMIPMMYR